MPPWRAFLVGNEGYDYVRRTEGGVLCRERNARCPPPTKIQEAKCRFSAHADFR